MATIEFLSLPAEIRCMVYAFHFAGGVATHRDYIGRRQALDQGEHSKRWQILLTCRLVKQEARPIMYKSTRYLFRGLKKFFSLASMYPSLSYDLRHILIMIKHHVDSEDILHSISDATQLLGRGKSIESLEIDTKIGGLHQFQFRREEWAILQTDPWCLIAEVGLQDMTVMDTLADGLGLRGGVAIRDYCASERYVIRRRYIARG